MQKPKHLFYFRGDSHFLKDVHSYPPLPSQEADLIVVQIRLQFLTQVISKAVEHMVSRGLNYFSFAFIKWNILVNQENNLSFEFDYINQAIKLGYEWRVDVDELRIKYVNLLYLNHMDHLAHEVLVSIESDEKLISTFLVAAGK